MTKTTITTAKVSELSINKIHVGARRRKKPGALASLATSIETHGLIHPIVVRNGNELVCGARRLEACRKLGWSTIPVRRVETMSDDELRALELDENVHRADLITYEMTRQRLAEIRAVLSDGPSDKKPRGNKRKHKASRDEIARATGIAAPQQRALERHEALAQAYPFLQRDGWNQGAVLSAGDCLESLPPAERPQLAAILDQDGIPPKTARQILENTKDIPSRVRKQIYKLAASNNGHDHDRALSALAKLPSPPDPALTLLRKASHELEKARGVLHSKQFEKSLRTVHDSVVRVMTKLETYVRKEREHLWLKQ